MHETSKYLPLSEFAYQKRQVHKDVGNGIILQPCYFKTLLGGEMYFPSFLHVTDRT